MSSVLADPERSSSGASLFHESREATVRPKRIRILSAFVAAGALAVADAASATRVIELIEGAYEALLADVVLPASTAGFVTLPPCSTCPPTSLGVDSNTVYLVENAALPFADFLAAAGALIGSGRGRDAAVYVFYDLETKRVTRIALDDFATE